MPEGTGCAQNQTYGTREFAGLVGIQHWTARHWCNIGILAPETSSRKTKKQGWTRRMYTADDLDLALLAKHWIDSGQTTAVRAGEILTWLRENGEIDPQILTESIVVISQCGLICSVLVGCNRDGFSKSRFDRVEVISPPEDAKLAEAC